MDNSADLFALLGIRGFPFMAHIPKYKVYYIQNIHMDRMYLALTIYNVSNGDPSINGWYVLFCFGFAIVSLPAFALMTIVNNKIAK